MVMQNNKYLNEYAEINNKKDNTLRVDWTWLSKLLREIVIDSRGVVTVRYFL
jgi:hypothetical protein